MWINKFSGARPLLQYNLRYTIGSLLSNDLIGYYLYLSIHHTIGHRQFSIDYASGSLPQLVGVYDVNTLFKTTHTDENGKKVIEYTNSLGQLILSNTDEQDTHADAYDDHIHFGCPGNLFSNLNC